MPPTSNNMIEKVIREIEHLPTLPHVVAKVLAMTDSAKVNALDLAKEMDQSLSAKVLKVANSAYYGVRRVNSIQQAIVVIGFDTLKEIILTASFFHTFQDPKEVKAFQPLWQHSLECALVAKRLAWIYRYEALDEAYLGGLIHDIGKLVIHQYFPDQLRVIKSKNDEGIEELKAEKEVLGLTHAEIAGKMAKQWNFPDAVVEAIAHHHDEKWELNPNLGRILFYADRFVSGLVGFHRMLELFTQAGMRFPLNWHLNELKRVEEIFQEEMKKAAAIVSNPLSPS